MIRFLTLLLATTLATIGVAKSSTPKNDCVIVEGMYFQVDKDTQSAFLDSVPTTSIGKIKVPNQFNYDNLTLTVRKVNNKGFAHCNQITSIELGSNILSLGDSVFSNCTQLETLICNGAPLSVQSKTFAGLPDFDITIYVPDSQLPAWRKSEWKDYFWKIATPNTNTLTLHNLFYYLNQADSTASIEGCKKEGKSLLFIQDDVQKDNQTYTISQIGERAFSQCHQINTISIPETITTIESNAFIGCENIKELDLDGSTPPSIGGENEPSAFPNTPMDIPVLVPQGALKAYQNHERWGLFTHLIEKDVLILDGVRYEKVEGMDYAAVAGCDIQKTGKISIPRTLTISDTKCQVTAILDNAFLNCSQIDTILTTNNINEIGDSVFYGCKQLKYAALSDSAEYLGEYSFYECSSLEQIQIPSSLIHIHKYCFAQCKQLKEIEVPADIEKIDTAAFLQCTGLSSMKIKAIEPPIVEFQAFEGVNKNIPITVPKGTIPDYQTADGWKEFTNFIEDGSTQVQEVTDAPVFSVENGLIITEGPVTIYNLAGQDVTAQNGQLQGTYILVQDEKAVKVSVPKN